MNPKPATAWGLSSRALTQQRVGEHLLCSLLLVPPSPVTGCDPSPLCTSRRHPIPISRLQNGASSIYLLCRLMGQMSRPNRDSSHRKPQRQSPNCASKPTEVGSAESAPVTANSHFRAMAGPHLKLGANLPAFPGLESENLDFTSDSASSQLCDQGT